VLDRDAVTCHDDALDEQLDETLAPRKVQVFEPGAQRRGKGLQVIGQPFDASLMHGWRWRPRKPCQLDVMRRPACSHRLRVVATITEQVVVTKILDPLKVRKAPLPCAPARDPTWVQESFAYDHAVA
jgi:hypothetical protein